MSSSPDELLSRIAELETLLSRTRHDIRSALAAALLAADMLRESADPKTQRSGATVVRAVERVMALLDATRDLVPSRPPGRTSS